MQMSSPSIFTPTEKGAYKLLNVEELLDRTYQINLQRMVQLVSRKYIEFPIPNLQACSVKNVINETVNIGDVSIVDLDASDSKRVIQSAKQLRLSNELPLDKCFSLNLMHPNNLFADEIKFCTLQNLTNAALLTIRNHHLLVFGVNLSRITFRYTDMQQFNLVQIVMESLHKQNKLIIDFFSHCNGILDLLNPITITNVSIMEPYFKLQIEPVDIDIFQRFKPLLLTKQLDFSVVMYDEELHYPIRIIPLQYLLQGSTTGRFAASIDEKLGKAELFAVYEFIPDVVEDLILNSYKLFLMYKPFQYNIRISDFKQGSYMLSVEPASYSSKFKFIPLQKVELVVTNWNNEITVQTFWRAE